MTVSHQSVAEGDRVPFWTGPRVWAASTTLGLVLAVVSPLPFGAQLSGPALGVGVAITAVSLAYAGAYHPRRTGGHRH